MNIYPDTSFLCALFRKQIQSPSALVYMESASGPLPLSWLVKWEFRHSIRFQIWLFSNDRSKGFSVREGREMLKTFEQYLTRGLIEVVPINEQDVHLIAERLSDKYAAALGARAMDTLHLATAIHLGAENFLTFDGKQKEMAVNEGLIVPV